MPDAPWLIRPAAAGDAGFLAGIAGRGRELVTGGAAAQPRPGALRSPDGAYITGWPRDGDLGVVAEAGGEPAGAAWLRFRPESDPGYGFAAAGVPELGISVTPAGRGRGLGRALLQALAGQARTAGIARISLSVERKNFARQLYLSEGYPVVDSSDPQPDTRVAGLTGR